MPLPWIRLAAAMLAGALYGFVAASCALPPLGALAASVAAGAGLGWLLAFDLAAIGPFAWRALEIAAGVGALGVLVAGVGRRFEAASGEGRWTAMAGATILIAGLKLSFLAHPAAVAGDALFHVHRAEWVHAGKYFFTSMTPPPGYAFPYAIGLYVAALPLWDLVPAVVDRVLLLRGLALAADSAAGWRSASRCVARGCRPPSRWPPHSSIRSSRSGFNRCARRISPT